MRRKITGWLLVAVTWAAVMMAPALATGRGWGAALEVLAIMSLAFVIVSAVLWFAAGLIYGERR